MLNVTTQLINTSTKYILSFVAQGGWLGASCASYATPFGLDLPDWAFEKALKEAERINPDLWSDSQINFQIDSERG